MPMNLSSRRLAALFPFVLASLSLSAAPADYFAIQVVDADTGRGVPMVELQTTNRVRYDTDSAGLVAFYEPSLMDRKVWFGVSDHGYESPADGFGM